MKATTKTPPIEAWEGYIPELSLSIRSQVKVIDRTVVGHSRDADRVFRKIWQEDLALFECFYILTMNKANKILGFVQVSIGTVSATLVDTKRIFQPAILQNATGVILAHNHPSGSSNPSRQDIRITHELEQAGKILNIKVLDHLIITESSYYSFLDHGRILEDK